MSRPHGRRRDVVGVHFGVSGRKVRDALELQRLAPHLADEVLRGRLKLSRALAEVKLQQQRALIEATPPPSGRYRTLVVDPPWHYEDSFCSGAARHHYKTMADADILKLPVMEWACPDAHLYLWATAPKLDVALCAVAAWGFRYKTLLVWRKNRLGLGRYFRSQAEYVLFATRGRLPLRSRALSNVFDAKVTKHSAKPDAFFALAEEASFKPRVELFARQQRPGWTCWGAEASAGPRAPAIHMSTPPIKTKEGRPV